MSKFLKTEKGWYMWTADGYRRLEWTPSGVVMGEKLNA